MNKEHAEPLSPRYRATHCAVDTGSRSVSLRLLLHQDEQHVSRDRRSIERAGASGIELARDAAEAKLVTAAAHASAPPHWLCGTDAAALALVDTIDRLLRGGASIVWKLGPAHAAWHSRGSTIKEPVVPIVGRHRTQLARPEHVVADCAVTVATVNIYGKAVACRKGCLLGALAQRLCGNVR